MFTYYSRW